MFGFRVLLPINEGGLSVYELKFEFGLIVLLCLIGIVKSKTLLIAAGLAPLIDFISHGHEPQTTVIEMFFFVIWVGGVILLLRLLFQKENKNKNKKWKYFIFCLFSLLYGIISLTFSIFLIAGIFDLFKLWNYKDLNPGNFDIKLLIVLLLNTLKLGIVVFITFLIRRKRMNFSHFLWEK